MTSQKSKNLMRIRGFLLFMVAIAVCVWLLSKLLDEIDIDRCLDLGGSWKYSETKCEKKID